MILRGVQIVKIAVTKKEKGAHVGRLTVRLDPVKELIERMGWDCLLDSDGKFTNGWDTFPLKGEIALVSAKLVANRKDGTKCEVKASEISGFSAHRIKSGKDEGTTVYIGAVIVSADEEFGIRADGYWRAIGDGKSVLTAKEAQASMFPEKEEKDAGEEPETEAE